jgi:hypothetical protein
MWHKRFILAGVLTALAAGAPAGEPAATDQRSPGEAAGAAVLVLPFESDEAGLGEKVRAIVQAKARRAGATVFDPSSVAEALAGRTVGPQTAAADLARLARETFKADLAVTGEVRGTGPYDIRMVAVHADGGDAPVAWTKRIACEHHQAIPSAVEAAVREMLGLGEPDDPLARLRGDAAAERRWREGPNLVPNGDFETPGAGGGGPAEWQAIENQMAYAANPDGAGKVLKFDMNQSTAEVYGLDFYSAWIQIEAGAAYRFSCRLKTLGPTPKVFLKGYHAFPGEGGRPAERRETYRRQVHPGGQKKQWNTVEADFVPESTRPDQTPTFLKVDLYAYWPAGVIYWDDIVLKKVRDAPPAPTAAPPAAGAKDPARPVSAPLTAAAPPAAGAAPQAGPGPAAKGSP